MAKELPYFKFEPAEYLTKDISFCSLSAQGLFINICSYYWQRNCELTKEQLLRRLNHETELNELIEEGVIDLVENRLFIKFLDNQLNEVENKSKTNSTNGSKGGRPKKNPTESETKPNLNPTESETISESKGIREDKIKEDKIKNTIEPINWPELLLFFNTTTNKNCKVVSKKVKEQFNARLKEGFTKVDIKNAIVNATKDNYHIETELKYVTLEFISRADKLDKFSQVKNNTSGSTNQKLMTYDN